MFTVERFGHFIIVRFDGAIQAYIIVIKNVWFHTNGPQVSDHVRAWIETLY
jgi:hypothetical protein